MTVHSKQWIKPAFIHLALSLLLSALVLIYGTETASGQEEAIHSAIPAVVRIIPQKCTLDTLDRQVCVAVGQGGSGVVIHPDGVILTAWHVTAQDNTNPLSTYWDNFVIEMTDNSSSPTRPLYRAKLMAAKPEMDLALLRIYQVLQSGQPVDESSNLKLPTRPLAYDAQLDLGDEMRILGFPYGGPSISLVSSELGGFEQGGALLRIHESLSKGYSGGPALIERDGELFIVGIVVRRRGELGEIGLLRSVDVLSNMNWLPTAQRVWASSIQMFTDSQMNDPRLIIDLTLHALDFDNRPSQLLAYFFDAKSGQPWRQGDPTLERTASDHVVLRQEVSEQGFISEKNISLSISLADLHAQPQDLDVRVVLWDSQEERALWKSKRPIPIGRASTPSTVTAPTSRVSEADEACNNVDLVVLLDRSISMQQNDPTQRSIYATRLLVDSLGNHILYECPDMSHRLSLLAFGGSMASIVDTVTIAPRLDAFREWEERRSAIRAYIADSMPYIDGGADHRAAFESAHQIFEQWQRTPVSDTPRQQHVIMITDGSPCTNIADGRCFGAGGSPEQYLADLEAYLDPAGSNFPWRGDDDPQSTSLWLIAMNDITQSEGNYRADPALRASWERIVGSHNGDLILLDSSGDANSMNYDISVAVADIADEITQVNPPVSSCTGIFYIEPYLDRVMLRILKAGSNPGVPFEDVEVSIVYTGPKRPSIMNGRVTDISFNIADYISDGPREHYVLNLPTPGEYEFEVAGGGECREGNVSYVEYPLDGKILEPTANQTLAQFGEPPYYDPNEPDYMRFAVYGGREEEQVPIFSDPDFPLSLSATIERPDGSSQALSFREQTDGTWRSEQAIEVALAGEYSWRLTGMAESPDPDIGLTDRFTPTSTGRFTVRPVQRFNIQILEPQPEASFNLLRIAQGEIVYESFDVLIQPQEENSRNALESFLFRSNAGISPFWVRISNSLQESSTIPVTYDPMRSAWVARVTPGENGVPVLLGAQTLTVELNPEGYNRNDLRPSSASGGQASIQINRTIQLNGGRILSPESAVAQYDEEPFYDPESPVHFHYQIAGYAGGTALAASLPPERLKVEMSVSDTNQKTQAQELVSVGDGVWESPTPLVLPITGDYEWAVTVSARNAADTNLIGGFADSGRFTVNRVGRYRIEVLSPRNGESYPLNRIADGQIEEMPLFVEVALVDTETGQYLTAEDLKSSVDPSQVFSVTVQGMFQSTGPIELVYDAVSQTWRRNLGLAAGEAPDEESLQTLAVTFNDQSVDRSKYRPSNDLRAQDRAQFERVRIQPLALAPQRTEIRAATHGGPTLCYNAQVIPLEVLVAVVRANGFQEVLDVISVVRDQVEPIAKVALIDPISRQTLEEGRLELVSLDGNLALKAIVGETYVRSGTYELQIIPQNDALLERYQFLSVDPIPITVTRTSNFLYAPSTCQGIQYTGIGLAIMLMGYMLYCGLRRPIGLLELLDDKGNFLNEYQLGKNLSLSFRTSQWINAVPDPDIGKIEVKRGDPQDAAFSVYGDDSLDKDNKKKRTIRAVKIIVYDQAGKVIAEHTLVSGMEKVPISMNTQIRYT